MSLVSNCQLWDHCKNEGASERSVQEDSDRYNHGTYEDENYSSNASIMRSVCTSLHLAQGCPIPETLWRQGIEHQPGPRWHAKDGSGCVVVESTNITALSGCAAMLADRGSHVAFMQEHSVPRHGLLAWVRTFAACQYLFDAGPLDPELNRAGGVAALATDPFQLVPYQPAGPNYMKAYEMGRLAAHWCEVGSETVLCWNMYGWIGAGTINLDIEQSNEAAQTD